MRTQGFLLVEVAVWAAIFGLLALAVGTAVLHAGLADQDIGWRAERLGQLDQAAHQVLVDGRMGRWSAATPTAADCSGPDQQAGQPPPGQSTMALALEVPRGGGWERLALCWQGGTLWRRQGSGPARPILGGATDGYFGLPQGSDGCRRQAPDPAVHRQFCLYAEVFPGPGGRSGEAIWVAVKLRSQP